MSSWEWRSFWSQVNNKQGEENAQFFQAEHKMGLKIERWKSKPWKHKGRWADGRAMMNEGNWTEVWRWAVRVTWLCVCFYILVTFLNFFCINHVLVRTSSPYWDQSVSLQWNIFLFTGQWGGLQLIFLRTILPNDRHVCF